MALTTPIMTVSEVKTLAVVNSNLDTAYLDQYIIDSQRQYIRDYLGNDFYEELLDQIDNTATLTSDNNTLIEDYIKPSLAHYVVFESLPQIRNQITKGGIYNNTSDTSEASSALDFGNLRTDYITKGERLREEIDFFIKDYRKTNTNAYPLYCGVQSQSGGIILY